MIGNLELRDERDRPAQSMDRIGQPEGAVAVTAGTFESDPVAITPYPDVGNPEPRAIDGNKTIDPAFETLVEKVLNAAQVPEPFLAHGTDECERSIGLDVVAVQRVDDANDHGKAAAIVADSRPSDEKAVARCLHHSPLRKDCIKMRAEDQVRARRPAGSLTQDVANLVDPYVPQSQFLEATFVGFGALALLERRRRYFAKTDLLFQELRFALLHRVECRAQRRISDQARSDLCPLD